jgi:putative nucleotidyltransferase with HDIG domain
VTAASPAASAEHLTDDALIERARSSQSHPLSRLDSTGLLAVAFLVAAIAVAVVLPARGDLSLTAVAVSLVCYALASRVNFEFATGFVIPTQGVAVTMWFILPPRMLPLVVCGGLVLAWVPELARRKFPAERLALLVLSSWHAFGPMLVLYFWGVGAPRWSSAPVYAVALLAQFVCDYFSAFLCARAVLGVSALNQLRGMSPAFAVDTLLAPLGLLVAFSAYPHPLALLLVVPVLVLFSTFATERQRRIDHTLELSSAYRGTAILLGDVIEADDEYTGSHSRDVVDLALAVADELGLSAEDRRNAEFTALLHDVGKVKIPSEIINKPGPLDDAERELMNTHTIVGQEMLDHVGGQLGEVGHLVRSCHERWDGSGYPDGLAGEDIPLVARIVCTCDAWSAMTTDRVYRKALTTEEATAELRRCAGTHFDPRVVDALVAVLAE